MGIKDDSVRICIVQLEDESEPVQIRKVSLIRRYLANSRVDDNS